MGVARTSGHQLGIGRLRLPSTSKVDKTSYVLLVGLFRVVLILSLRSPSFGSTVCVLAHAFDGNRQHGHKKSPDQVEVTFALDANGILAVTAQDTVTGAKAGAEIKAKDGRLSADEIDKMVQDAEKHRAQDDELADKVRALTLAPRTPPFCNFLYFFVSFVFFFLLF